MLILPDDIILEKDPIPPSGFSECGQLADGFIGRLAG
jgi:hypothetical protein